MSKNVLEENLESKKSPITDLSESRNPIDDIFRRLTDLELKVEEGEKLIKQLMFSKHQPQTQQFQQPQQQVLPPSQPFYGQVTHQQFSPVNQPQAQLWQTTNTQTTPQMQEMFAAFLASHNIPPGYNPQQYALQTYQPPQQPQEFSSFVSPVSTGKRCKCAYPNIVKAPPGECNHPNALKCQSCGLIYINV